MGQLLGELRTCRYDEHAIETAEALADAQVGYDTLPNPARDAPLEIIQHIFSMVARRHLRHLRLVCRSWHDASLRTIYRTLTLRLHPNLPNLVAFLVATPSTASLVREITIDCTNTYQDEAVITHALHPLSRVLQRGANAYHEDAALAYALQPLARVLRSVETLILIRAVSSSLSPRHTPLFAHMMETYGATVRKLCINAVRVASPFFLDEFLSAFPQLASLCVHSVCIPPSEAAPPRWPFGPVRFDGRRVSTLAFEWVAYATKSAQESLAVWLVQVFPGLEVLELHPTSQTINYSLMDIQGLENIIVHALSQCPALRLIHFFVQPVTPVPLADIIPRVLRTYPYRKLAFAVYFGYPKLPKEIKHMLHELDTAVAELAPKSAWTFIFSSHNAKDWSDKIRSALPFLSQKGIIELSHISSRYGHSCYEETYSEDEDLMQKDRRPSEHLS